MSILKNEIKLVPLLAEQLRKDLKDILWGARPQPVHVNVNLASRKFYHDFHKYFGAPIAQPQIDILLVDKRLDLLAIELKYFRFKGKRKINYPFYEGIGETLALLRFGFVVVSLWHCFDQEIALDVVKKYKDSMSILIGVLNLPINYSTIRVVKVNEQIRFREFLDDMSETERISSPHGKSNPLRSLGGVKNMEDFLRKSLKIPKRS